MFRLGSDPKKLFPFEQLLDQLRKFGRYSVYVGALLFPILNVDVDQLPDFDEFKDDPKTDSWFQISPELKKAYNKKVTDVFDDLARFEYI